MKNPFIILILLFLLNPLFRDAICQEDSVATDFNNPIPGKPFPTLESLSLSEINYQWISYRMKLTLEKDSATSSFQVFFVNKIDSVIYLNFNVSGIEIIRIVMTPEKITYVNKMDYNYFIADYSQFSRVLGLKLDFYMVQSIFNATDFKYFENNFRLFEDETNVHLVAEKRCNLLKDNCLTQEILLDNSHRIIENAFSCYNASPSLRVNYSNYLPVDSVYFFSGMNLEMNHLSMKVSAEVKNVKFNVPGPTSIRIPDTFEQIKFP